MTFSSPTAATSAAELQAFMIVMEEIREVIAGQLGAPFNTNPSLISFSMVQSGSVKVGGNVDTSQSSSSSAAFAKVSTVQPSGGYPGFQMVSSSYVANGFTADSTTTVNMPLILGIAIPVGLLFIIVSVVVIVRLKKRANAIKEVQKVDDFQISPQNEVKPVE